MKRIIKYKNYILGVIGVLLILTMFVGVKYLIKPKYEELPEVKLKDIKSSKSFAIMIQNGDGYEEYTSEDNTWPGSDYVFKEAKCTDNNGALVDNAISFADGKAILETDKTIYCTLYFDESIIGNLRTKDTQGYLSKDLQGGMYRYQAAFEDSDSSSMTNWICFGTTDNCGTDETDSDSNNIPDGIDKYMYRIIGITEEGELYLIKETFLKEGNETSFAWNDKYYTSGDYNYTCDNKICPEWGQNNLFKRINGTSNGTIQGNGNYTNNANTDIFVDSINYDYLKSGDGANGTISASKWYNLITDHDWMYGDTRIGSEDESMYTGNEIYAIETGKAPTKHYVGIDENNTEETYTWSKSVKAKISLMYIHDYVYSYYDGNNPKTRGNPKNYSTAKNGWLYFQKDGYNTTPTYEWLSNRCGVYAANNAKVTARDIYNDGRVGDGSLFTINGVRPVFYLSSKLKIASGDGTKVNPYILEI